MKKIALFVFVVACYNSNAQQYQPTWESLDTRPVPSWYKDAKFGIFIHWGVYSVPGWCSKGNYAEWYQYGLQTTDTARMRYHKEKFGNATYYQLADQFKAELFKPAEWAKLFEQSGAKYIVLTSKHHDGYCLWPSKDANRTWGFQWNAADVGPKRDLIGDLFKEVRKTSVHAGMYYSLYEWFNPLWKKDQSQYAQQHMWPQMKELITNYQPEVFWTDGDWDASENVWKSKEFLAWLYNESSVKDKIVTIDRWGSGVRFHHGGVYSPEYQPELQFEDHYWEESRGMGYSYGYNREEDAWDYNSTQSLIIHLIDKVSRGGNFLLDIGPDEHGKIPPIMQERLLQIGEWMNVNGEAIYNTSRWKVASQWSEGRRDYTDRGGDVMLKLTVNPDPGYAVKELFFTYNDKTNSLYAIFPKYPDSKKITIKNVSLPAGTTISFLSTNEKLNWVNKDGNVEIVLPEYNPNKIKAPFAYALKIDGFGKFMAKPKMKVEYLKNSFEPTVTIEAEPGAQIMYRLDHADAKTNPAWTKYQKPMTFNNTTIVSARVVSSTSDAILPSDEVTVTATKYDLLPAAKVSPSKNGLAYKYYEPAGKIDMHVFEHEQPKATGIAEEVNLTHKQRVDKFAFEFEGYINVAKDGLYEFSLASDDGSFLWVDNLETINNDGEHGNTEVSGKAALRKGFHAIKIRYFDSGGGNSLSLKINTEGGTKAVVKKEMLWH
jgi:alpha-L-fucosidase